MHCQHLQSYFQVNNQILILWYMYLQIRRYLCGSRRTDEVSRCCLQLRRYICISRRTDEVSRYYLQVCRYRYICRSRCTDEVSRYQYQQVCRYLRIQVLH